MQSRHHVLIDEFRHDDQPAFAALNRARLIEHDLLEGPDWYSRGRGAQRLMLLSNSRLVTALRLYEGLGSRCTPVPADALYVTADVSMELDL